MRLFEISDKGNRKMDANIGVTAPPNQLTEREYQSLIIEYNNSAAPYPADETIVALFEAQVARTPTNKAVQLGDRSVTYTQLNERANQMAAHLRSRGIGPGRLVTLYMEHSIEVVCAILGVLKAGAAYVPVDPSTTPEERLAFILQDIAGGTDGASSPVLITQSRLLGKIPENAAEVVVLDSDFAQIERYATPNPEIAATPHDLAYVIYTSGSTGKPKGVLIEHRSLVNYIWWANQKYCRGEQLSWPLFSSLAFDLTVTSIFTPLISGGRILVYAEDSGRHWTAILRVAEDGQADIVKLTPSHLAMIKGMNPHATRIRKFIVGGEDFKTDLAREVSEKINHPVEIYNEYGPTEATVGCMIHLFDANKDRGASVPIGVPASNFGIYILDDLLNPVPTGVIGEMYLAGDGLARGYLNQPELTAQKFIMVKDPRHSASVGRSSDAKLRVYKTGDLARWNADGQLEFLGRADFQVKIGGMRIELGEIESRLMSHPDIRECVVDVTRHGVTGTSQASKDSSGDDTERDRLVAYYVSEKPLPVADVRAHLAKELPDYMVPPYVVWLEKLPLTPNGKIDRNAMPVPRHEHMQPAKRHLVQPRTATEKALSVIWKELLGIDDIGIDDDLFNLGGDSLLPIRAESRIRKAFEVNIGIQALFDNPTIAGLAYLLDESKNPEQTEKAIAPLFYRRGWVKTETPAVASAEPGRWMIFMDSLGLGSQISAQLKGAQHQVIEVRPGVAFTRVRKGEYLLRPGNRADYDALILDVTRRGVLPQRIINLWPLCDGSEQIPADETLNLTFYSLVNLAQTLKDQDLSGVDIAVVSNRLQSVSGEPIVAPLRATMLAPVRTIPKEIPGTVCRSIDCDPLGQGTGYVAVQVITEHLSPFTDQVVAYRGDERWVESLERLELPKTATQNRVKMGATYLITGGLGSLGLIVAEHLARHVQAKLILLDQTPLPPSAEWEQLLANGDLPEHTRGMVRKLTEIQSLGCEVMAVCADTNRTDEMKRTFELARTKFGHINGVIHAAPVRDLNALQLKTEESAAPVLASKIIANFVWEEVLRDESLDFLALFSSASSLLVGAEQIDGAATAAFLDAFTCNQKGKPVVAIDWRSRVDLGESAADFALQSTDKDPRKFEMPPAISAAEAAEAFARVLAMDMPATVIVSAQDLRTVTSAAKTGTTRVSGPSISSDDVESVLLTSWQEFSDSRQVTLDDNFFDLGGDSLAAVQLFSKIKATYGLNLGLATLFETPTIRQLSNLIRQASSSGPAKTKPWSPIVPIQPKGKRPPLYVISGLGGNVIKFHSLAFHLGEDQPIFGLLPRGLDGKDSFHTRIEDMAAYYVEAIRTMQPQGPYCLAGYSFGGIVAFEVAQQIVAQGGNVTFLGLFDAIEWHYADKVDGSLGASQRMTVLKEHLKNIIAGPDRYAYINNLLRSKMVRSKYHLFNLPDRLDPGKIGALEEVNGYAAGNYYPKTYPGKLTLFRSTKRAVQQGNDEYLGWGELARDGVDVHHVPGTHFSILQEPEVRRVAEKLRSCLEPTIGAN